MVFIGSFVAANVLRLVRCSIERRGTRIREHSVGVLQVVQSAKTLGKCGHIRLPLLVGCCLSASSIFDEVLSQVETLIFA